MNRTLLTSASESRWWPTATTRVWHRTATESVEWEEEEEEDEARTREEKGGREWVGQQRRAVLS